jgi:hypothetical protein
MVSFPQASPPKPCAEKNDMFEKMGLLVHEFQVAKFF